MTVLVDPEIVRRFREGESMQALADEAGVHVVVIEDIVRRRMRSLLRHEEASARYRARADEGPSDGT